MKKKDKRDLLIYFSFVSIGLFIYLFIVAYPIFYSIWLSFTDFNPNKGGDWNFVGFLQYKTMLEDPNFYHALGNNMIIVLVSVFG
ncbi:MAG: sugar ABC transporter permease, partial [Spirochaetes bacterium]|nr:sugar ABC transporter permease [Spirochaetota bacterium]